MTFDFLPELPKENLDDRTFEDLVAECILRIPRYCPEWTDYNPSDPGITLIELFAWLTDQMLMRLNKVPRRNYITFLELLGINLQPPSSATTNLTFYITEPDNFPFHIPRGIEVATERSPKEEAIIFSTTEDLWVIKPIMRHFLTAQTRENSPQRLREGVVAQWTRSADGEWTGSEQPLFDEQPNPGNCFYLVFAPDLLICGNVLAVSLKGLAASPTGIDPDAPPRTWEAWDGETWQPILRQAGDDFSRGFSFSQTEIEEDGSPSQTADIILHLPQQLPITVFTGYEGHWIRCVYTIPEAEQPGYNNSPQIIGIKVRAVGGTVAASHSQIIQDEVLGISEGIPGQRFNLQAIPVLERRPDEYLLVTPPGGLPQMWQEVKEFSESTSQDRHYMIDSITGVVQLGPLIQEPGRGVTSTKIRAQMSELPVLENYSSHQVVENNRQQERQYGCIPPRGSEIKMRCYQTGGGHLGNVEKRTLKVLRSSIPYINSVINYTSAQGGSNAESLEQAVMRVPKMLRTRDRAVTKEDFEALTLEAGGGAISQVLCIPPTQSHEAGTVSLVIVPTTDTRGIEQAEGIAAERFELSPILARQTLAYLDQRKVLGIQIRLHSANYVGVSVEAQIGLEPIYNNPQAKAELGLQLERMLYRFLNPLTGGIEQKGWIFGRPVYVSDIIALFQKTPGVRYIGPVWLYAILPTPNTPNGWLRDPDPLQMIDPGPRGLICSWKNRQIRSSHSINYLES